MTRSARATAESIELREVAAQAVPAIWPEVAPLLGPALRYHPFLDLHDLHVLLVTSYARLIVVREPGGDVMAAIVIERVRYPSRVVANILALGAQPGRGISLMPAIADYCEAWSRALGCDTIAVVGRLGWTRVLCKRAGDKSLRLAQCWRRLHQQH